MTTTAIEWTDAVWNPVTGCSRVSPGCAHCYALELAPRLRAMGSQKYIGARDGGKGSGPAFGVTLHPDELEAPLRWRKPRRVFVNSMSDLFHDEVPERFIASVFATMALADRHTFQVLTKRPERMRALLSSGSFAEQVDEAFADLLDGEERIVPWPLPNVWLGVSIENRRYVHRADILRATPAAVRFISAEPLLGPLLCEELEDNGWPQKIPVWRDGHDGDQLDLDRIDWLIVGGESGVRHRTIDPVWVRALRDACVWSRCPDCFDDRGCVDCGHCHCDGGTGTAFFFKQWGGRTPKAGGRDLDGRTWDEMPAVVA